MLVLIYVTTPTEDNDVAYPDLQSALNGELTAYNEQQDIIVSSVGATAEAFTVALFVSITAASRFDQTKKNWPFMAVALFIYQVRNDVMT